MLSVNSKVIFFYVLTDDQFYLLEISAAYEVLSDEDKRQTYDRFGLEGLKEGRGGGGGFGGDDLFSMFFGGGSPFGKLS